MKVGDRVCLLPSGRADRYRDMLRTGSGLAGFGFDRKRIMRYHFIVVTLHRIKAAHSKASITRIIGSKWYE